MNWKCVYIAGVFVTSSLNLSAGSGPETGPETGPVPLVVGGRSLVLHWSFDGMEPDLVRDQSGRNQPGKLQAVREVSPAGHAAVFDGERGRFVEGVIANADAFANDSWSVSLWVKPRGFSYPSSQNQRRLLYLGRPDGDRMVLDITGEGRPSVYFERRDAEGNRRTVSAGAGATLPLHQWSHLALVVDREQGKIDFYLNGQKEGSRAGLQLELGEGFGLPEVFTLGSRGWQNYHGAVDEFRIFRSALSAEEVRLEAQRDADAFQPRSFSRESLNAAWTRVGEALDQGQQEAALAGLRTLRAEMTFPPAHRSIAGLREARLLERSGDLQSLQGVYEHIRDEEDFPRIHREEASGRLRELERVAEGLPARDPDAARRKITPVSDFAQEWFVGPDGCDDTGAGTAERPFATLARAQREMRAWQGEGALAITLLPGVYVLSEPWRFDPRDSGTEDAPRVVRAAVRGESVLYGGRRIHGFERVSDPAVLARLPEEARGKVYQSDLRGQGIEDFGELRVRGFGQGRPPPTMELYFNGEPMTLARWPNEGFVRIRELVDPGDHTVNRPAVIGWEDTRHARWLDAEDPWIFGYFRFLWADATLRIAGIDPVARTLTTATPYMYENLNMNNRQGILYHVLNLLEEIDQPGEWYLNRDTGMLYFYPPADPAESIVELGMLSTAMVEIRDTRHLRFEGLVFDLARDNGIEVIHAHHVLFAGCTVRRVAGNGIRIEGGTHNGIFGCDLHTLGRRGTELLGGDRRTLSPASHFVENSHIHRFGRIDRTYTPAVHVEGVGSRIAYNLFHDAPSSVLRIEGNDHTIEFNEVHTSATESDDQGAVDMYRNPMHRGNVFRYNYFHEIGRRDGKPVVLGQAAIRFDDAISGQLVYSNIMVRSSNGNFGAVHMNSGRDNIIDNNLIIDSQFGITGGWRPENSVWRGMLAGNHPQNQDFHESELYLDRYPELARLLDGNGENFLWRNVFVASGLMVRGYRHDRHRFDLIANLEFTDAEAAGLMGLRFDPASPVFARAGFRPIPVEEIGLYEHPLRASWPVRHHAESMPDWRTQVPPPSNPHPGEPIRLTVIPEASEISIREPIDTEWPGVVLSLRETPHREPIQGEAPEARLVLDGKRLLISVRVQVEGLSLGNEWGKFDGVEICLRDKDLMMDGRRPPTFIFQGFPNGHHRGDVPLDEWIAIARVREAAARVSFAAETDAESGVWTATWSIPLEAVDIPLVSGKEIQFNIGVRRTAGKGEWIALAGTMGPNHQLDNAATLILE